MIFGQSAGGWGVVDLLMTEKTEETGVEGLWSSAIIQSGGASLIQSLDEAAETICEFAVLPSLARLSRMFTDAHLCGLF